MINGLPAAPAAGTLASTPHLLRHPADVRHLTGSSKVFIGGKRAARMIDITMHRKPGEGAAAAASGGVLSTPGKVATAAAVGADVMDAVEGDPAAAARLAVMAAQAAADAVANAMKASMAWTPACHPARWEWSCSAPPMSSSAVSPRPAGRPLLGVYEAAEGLKPRAVRRKGAEPDRLTLSLTEPVGFDNADGNPARDVSQKTALSAPMKRVNYGGSLATSPKEAARWQSDTRLMSPPASSSRSWKTMCCRDACR